MNRDRKYFLTAVGILSFFTALRLPFFRKRRENTGRENTGRENIACAPGAKGETRKFLGEDGRLIEVDISRIRMVKPKISDEELKGWVKRSS